jgi:transposase, IS30 family
MRRSLSWDRGVEMTRHAEFTSVSGIPVYICDAYCPWQRGSNKDRLLRHYFLKKADLFVHSPEHVLAVVHSSTNAHDRRSDGRLQPRS